MWQLSLSSFLFELFNYLTQFSILQTEKGCVLWQKSLSFKVGCWQFGIPLMTVIFPQGWALSGNWDVPSELHLTLPWCCWCRDRAATVSLSLRRWALITLGNLCFLSFAGSRAQRTQEILGWVVILFSCFLLPRRKTGGRDGMVWGPLQVLKFKDSI